MTLPFPINCTEIYAIKIKKCIKLCFFYLHKLTLIINLPQWLVRTLEARQAPTAAKKQLKQGMQTYKLVGLMGLGKKTALLVIFSFNILIVACNNEKKDFDTFFNKLNTPALLDTLKGINRIIMFREDCVYYFRFDTIQISFATNYNCQPEIRNISKVIDDKPERIGKYDEHLVQQKVNYFYQLMKEYSFIGVENKSEQRISILFNITNFDLSTMPEYNIQDIGKNEFNTGILVLDYDRTYPNTSEYDRYKPIKLNDSWYFYKIISEPECNCIK